MWPGAWSLGPLHLISSIYVIIFMTIEGGRVEDIATLLFAAAAGGLAPWLATGCRLPSGAMKGILQAFLLVVFSAWPVK